MILSACLGKLIEKTMMRKFGVENINQHFKSFNTICNATQVGFLKDWCMSNFEDNAWHIDSSI